jgi:hypothetical protein
MEGHEVMEINYSPRFCSRSTNKGSFGTDMCRCIFHSSASDTFAKVLLPKPPLTNNFLKNQSVKGKKVKQSRYTPWRRLGGEEV